MYPENNFFDDVAGIILTLQVLFVTLKLFNLLTWSWWLVFSPIWVTALVVLIFVLIALWMVRER